MRSYNLFRLKSVEGLCCAVPEASLVPTFLGGGRWTFGGKLDGESRVPLDFDDRAAETGIRFNGFYLFQTVDQRFFDAGRTMFDDRGEHSLRADMEGSDQRVRS